MVNRIIKNIDFNFEDSSLISRLNNKKSFTSKETQSFVEMEAISL